MTDNSVAIFPIPLVALGSVWTNVSPLLLRGLAESPSITLGEVIDALFEGVDQLWVIFVGSKLTGAFVSHLFEDEEGRGVDVYALSGRDVSAWGKPLSRVMTDYAKGQGCIRVIFCGRKGLLRAYEGVRIVREMQPGIYQFERVV